MSILKPVAEIVQTDDPASRILAPTPVGGHRCAAEIDNQIPRFPHGKLVFGME
jgi:hypothetical protein